MTSYLLGRGYQRVAFVGLPGTGNERVRERRRGYYAALASANIVRDDALVLETVGGVENGARALLRLMEICPEVDAIFFAGDVLAIGAMMECARRGWDVPRHVAIAGFDDWEISRQFATPVTTLDIPRYRIGEHAAELMLRRLDGDKGQIEPVDVGFRIIERQST